MKAVSGQMVSGQMVSFQMAGRVERRDFGVRTRRCRYRSRDGSVFTAISSVPQASAHLTQIGKYLLVFGIRRD